MRRPSLKRPRRLRGLSINALIPNAVTVLGMCAGLSSIRYALADRWEFAVAMILLAGIIDGLDGRIARVLKASSDFGAELDSLSDFVCFGVAPAVVLYLWTLEAGRGVGWAISLLFAVCMALRLARFNASLSDPDRPVWASHFFAGVPAPSASGIVLVPMMLSFEFGDTFLREPLFVALYTIGVAFLTVLLLVGLLFAVFVGYPWYAFSALALGYAATIPFSVRSHRRHKARTDSGVSVNESTDV